MPAVGTAADPFVLGDSDDSDNGQSFQQIIGIIDSPRRRSRPSSNRSSPVKQETSAARSIPSPRESRRISQQPSTPVLSSPSRTAHKTKDAPSQSPLATGHRPSKSKEAGLVEDGQLIGSAQISGRSPRTPSRQTPHPPSRPASEQPQPKSKYTAQGEDSEAGQPDNAQALRGSQTSQADFVQAELRREIREDLAKRMALSPSTKCPPVGDERILCALPASVPEMTNEQEEFGESERATGEEIPVEEEGIPMNDDEGFLPRQRQLRMISRKSPDSSIGSSSPLIHRLTERRARTSSQKAPAQVETSSNKSPSAKLPTPKPVRTIAEIQDALRRFKKEMEEDQRATVRWLLHDSREGNPMIMPRDKVSPFAQVKSVRPVKTEAPSETQPLKVESQITSLTKKKPTRSKSAFITKSIRTDVSRVPSYSHHTAVRRNILSPDSEKLKYIPYILSADDSSDIKDHAKLTREFEAAYAKNTFVSSRDSEKTANLSIYLDDWLRGLDIGCTKQSLMRFLLVEGLDDSSSLRSKDKKLLLQTFGGPLKPDVTEVARRFSQAFENVFKISLQEVLFPDKYLKEKVKVERKKLDDAAKRKSNDLTDVYGTYTNLTCLICGVVSCQTHGDYQPQATAPNDSDGSEMDAIRPEEAEDIHDLLSLSYDATFRKHRERHAHDDVKSATPSHDPCSIDCYALQNCNPERKWTARVVNEVRRMWMTLRDPNERACTIAFILDLRCCDVHNMIERLEEWPGAGLAPVKAQPRRSKRPEWYDNKRKTLMGNWADTTEAHLHQERTQANPCSHEGPCNDDDCPCFRSNLLCESICACPDDCSRRFTGCSCISTGMTCTTDTCICIQMNRECGPQCSSCGAILRLNPTARNDDDLFGTGCQNVPLQRGVAKMTILGESQLEGTGYGLYAGESIQKGEYIGEYTGELITFSEADRRGIIYDRRYLSFLFDLNSEWAVDGARLGNEMRFLNHADSEDHGLNCGAKIMLVNGEHRIKFTASRDIAAGEELLFNYGKKFAEKHHLSKKLPKAKDGVDGSKGVIVGDEALKALDGLDSRREKGRSIVKGEHGTGGRKARKTAPVRTERRRENPKVPAPEEEILPIGDIPDGDDGDDFVLEEEDEDEDETGSDRGGFEDDDDERISDSRSRRKITRPLRYTR